MHLFMDFVNVCSKDTQPFLRKKILKIKKILTNFLILKKYFQK